MNQSLNLITMAGNYPSDWSPQRGAFVHLLMRDMRAMGAKPTVIAPEKILNRFSRQQGYRLASAFEVRDGLQVHRPRYLSMSNRRFVGGVSTFKWTMAAFDHAVRRGARSVTVPPDVCYGHFLYPAGLSAQRLGERLGVASVVALGEGSFEHYERHFGIERVREDLSRFSGVVAVSESIRERCIRRYEVSEQRIAVFPNAAGPEFHPRPRDEMRRRLGLPLERPIVAFVGHFDQNKGPHRVLEAIRGRPDIGAVFLGSGPVKIAGPQVLFEGRVPHDEVPLWLNAADVYVQPVFTEASSNSMREALACGLPVVSSDIPSNKEFLDSSIAILVDPDIPAEIGMAIGTLVDDPVSRGAMSRAALESAKRFSSIDRARTILDWIGMLPRR